MNNIISNAVTVTDGQVTTTSLTPMITAKGYHYFAAKLAPRELQINIRLIG